jgi:dTDP-glucose 4,6-dehydratase
MNVLITGCAGFIGSHAVDHFLESGETVVGVDSMTYASNITNLEDAFRKKEFVFYEKDIVNTSDIINICNIHSVDWIINFAAETHVDNSIDSCDSFIHSNIIGVKSLLECCRETGTRLFHISTDEVYGSTTGKSFEENDVLSPKNPYSATKAAAEHIINAYSNTHGVDFITVRMSNNFGPRQHAEKFIPTIIRSLSCEEKIPIYGNGQNVREWLYVKDCVKMIRSIHMTGKIGEVYNISSGNEKNNIEISKMICGILNKDFKKSFEFVPDRPGHDFRYAINFEKIKQMGIVVETDFIKAVEETVRSMT